MSKGTSCKCQQRSDRSFQLKNWIVRQYKCNHSAFNGWKQTPSDYSALNCLVCGNAWRTKAEYVYGLTKRRYSEDTKIETNEK